MTPTILSKNLMDQTQALVSDAIVDKKQYKLLIKTEIVSLCIACNL